jgi:hypothetical protein
MQITDFQNAVDVELRSFNENLPIGALNSYIDAIRDKRDPDEFLWTSGAAGHSSMKLGTPRFVKEAHQIVHQPSVRQRLCAALHSGTGDAFDIGKTLVPHVQGVRLNHTIFAREERSAMR